MKTRIWNTFSVLLQYACKTDFQTITNKIVEEYQKEIIEKENEQKTIEIGYQDKIKQMENYSDQLEKNFKVLEQENAKTILDKMKID